MKKLHSLKILILAILVFGVLYKLLITSGGNFIFNMDNARDMVDVREMVVLHKLRLTGPTSGIEGFYNGPGWYYLLAVPFILTGGDPYSEVLLMILLWVIGGYFLLKIASRFGVVSVLVAGSLWVASNYVTLDTIYAFNPNPVLLLAPMEIFFIERYLVKNNLLYGIAAWLLAGAFFNFEMAFGLFMPFIIFASILLSGRIKYFSSKNFWIGFGVFIATLLPQILFNFRHQGLLSSSLLNHLSSSQTPTEKFILPSHAGKIFDLYLSTTQATFMNSRPLEIVFVTLIFLIAGVAWYKRGKDRFTPLYASLCAFILIPILGSAIFPLSFMPWHVGGVMAAFILLFGILVSQFSSFSQVTKYIGVLFVLFFIGFSLNNLELPSNVNKGKVNADPSSFNNEISAVDFAYKEAQGKDFKAYVYMPSVIDYPYQYLFWWYGQKNYGYTPKDYAYLPDKPQYISNKEKFNSPYMPHDSGLTILIMQKDRPDLRDLWKNSFSTLSLVSSKEVGPFTVEVRK